MFLPNLTFISALALHLASEWNVGCFLVLKPDQLSTSESNLYDNLTAILSHSLKTPIWPKSVISATSASYVDAMSDGNCGVSFNLVVVRTNMKTLLEGISRRYDFRRTVWLLVIDKPDDSFFKDMEVTIVSNLFFMNSSIAHDQPAVVYEVYRASAQSPLRYNPIYEWQEATGGKVLLSERMTRRNILEGTRLRSVTLESWPMSSTANEDRGKEIPSGLLPQIIFELQEILNFTITEQPYDERKRLPGVQNQNGEWNGLIGMAARHEADLVLAMLTVTNERKKVIDFTLPIGQSRYQIYFPAQNWQFDWTTIFGPFDSVLWIAIAACVMIETVAHYTLLNFKKRCGCELEGTMKNKSFFFVLQTFCQQSTNEVPKSVSPRMVFFVCYVSAFIIRTAYSAALISSLTRKPFIRPFDSLEELYRSNFSLLVRGNTSDSSHFAESPVKLHREIFKKNALVVSKENISYGQLLSLMCSNENYALLAAENSLRNYFFRHKHQEECEVLKLTQPLQKIYYAIGLAQNSPYQHLFNFNLLKMMEFGIVERNERKFLPPVSKQKQNSQFRVHFFDVAEMFIFLLFAYVISFFILIYEIVQTKQVKGYDE